MDLTLELVEMQKLSDVCSMYYLVRGSGSWHVMIHNDKDFRHVFVDHGSKSTRNMLTVKQR